MPNNEAQSHYIYIESSKVPTSKETRLTENNNSTFKLIFNLIVVLDFYLVVFQFGL